MTRPTKTELSARRPQDTVDITNDVRPLLLPYPTPKSLLESKRFFSKQLRLARQRRKNAKTDNQRKQHDGLIAAFEYCLKDLARSAEIYERYRAQARELNRQVMRGPLSGRRKAMLRLMQLDKEHMGGLTGPTLPGAYVAGEIKA